MQRSYRYVTVVALGVFVLALWSASLFGQKEETPQLYIHSTDADIGDVLEGKDIEYIFHVRNFGKGELQIISVKPG